MSCLLLFSWGVSLAQSRFNLSEFVLRYDLSDPRQYVESVYKEHEEKLNFVRSIYKQADRNQLVSNIEWNDSYFVVHVKDHPELIQFAGVIDYFVTVFASDVDQKPAYGWKYSPLEQKLIARGLPREDLQALYQIVSEDSSEGSWLHTQRTMQLAKLTGDPNVFKRMQEAMKDKASIAAEDFRAWIKADYGHRKQIEKELSVYFLEKLTQRGRSVVLSYTYESGKEGLMELYKYKEKTLDEILAESKVVFGK